jgi:hypothetical protein
VYITAGKLKFSPALNAQRQQLLRAFTFQVQDDGGIANQARRPRPERLHGCTINVASGQRRPPAAHDNHGQPWLRGQRPHVRPPIDFGFQLFPTTNPDDNFLAVKITTPCRVPAFADLQRGGGSPSARSCLVS